MKEPQSSERSGLSQERLRRLNSALQGYVDRGEVAGLVAIIHRHGELAYTATFGWQDREAQLPMQRDTIFRIASLSKPVTAVAALTLVEEGRIRLFDPIDTWLPELANRMVLRDPNGALDDLYPSPRAITLHDLLTMRLGIGWGSSKLTPLIFALLPEPIANVLQIKNTEHLNPDAWMKRLGEFPLLYAPGERFLYHVGYDILGVLIARVAGQPFETVLRERIFGPLGMVDTGFTVPKEKSSRLAVTYATEPAGGLSIRDHPRENRWTEPPLFPSGGGGLVATADDYQRFGRMLLENGALDGVRILSRKTVEAMTTDYLTPEPHTHPFSNFARYDLDRSAMWTNRGFGYGVAVRTRRVGLGPSVGSFFWPGATGTLWNADPHEELMATLLTQVVGTNPFYTQIGEDFLALTYQAIAD